MTLVRSEQPADRLLGDQRPRIFCRPPGGVGSSGPEVIELAARAGLILDPWQQFLLLEGLAEAAGGNWLAFEVAELLSRQNGKGGVLEAVALGGLFLFGDRLIGWNAHEFKTCREGFLRVRALIDNTDELRTAGQDGSGRPMVRRASSFSPVSGCCSWPGRRAAGAGSPATG